MKDVLQGRFDPEKRPPITKWTAERDKLTVEKNRLDMEYFSLKYEVKEFEQIRRGVNDILREENRKEQPTRNKKWDMTR